MTTLVECLRPPTHIPWPRPDHEGYRTVSAWAISVLVDYHPDPVSNSERAVLLAMAAHADAALRSAHGYDGITAADLGRLLGYSEPTAARYQRLLIARGWAEKPGALPRVPEWVLGLLTS